MIRATLALLLAMLCAGLGNILLGKGMKTMGPLKAYRPVPLLKYFLLAAVSPYVILGIMVSTLYFFLWLIVLSWADVSWALPMNAVEYIFVTVMAIAFLREKVSWTRWVGIAFISMGVFFMMKSW